MMEKLEDFLFDILGLAIPGFVAMFVVLLLPLIIIDPELVDLSAFEHSILVTYVSNVTNQLIINTTTFSWLAIGFVFLVCYILGHVIKVISKYQYEFLVILFDQQIVKCCNDFLNLVDRFAGCASCKLIRLFNGEYRRLTLEQYHWYNFLISFVFGIVQIPLKLIRVSTTFKPANHYEDEIADIVAKTISNKYHFMRPKWYTVYKFANVVLDQEKIKTQSFKFLAKYNFYRSLACIFSLNFIYTLAVYRKYNEIINPLGHTLFYPILIINVVFWFTFHDKYKRYWSLCGNESLMGLFYYLYVKGGDKNGKQDSIC